MCVKAERETVLKLFKVEEHEGGSEGSKEGGTIWERILSILLMKNLRKCSQISGVASLDFVNIGLSIELIVSDKTLGLWTCLDMISEKYLDLSALTHF